MSDIQFWLSFNNGEERLRLPVNPESVRLSTGRNYTDVSIVGLGDYTIIGKHKHTEISFASFFPAQYDPSYCEYEDIPDPYDAVYNKIGRWKESGKPIRLTITGTPINYAVTIRKFDFDERFGSPGDVYYELQLREYVFVHVKKIEPAKPTANGKPATPAKISVKAQRPNPKTPPTTYTVKSGDNLTKIVQRMRTQGHKELTADKLYQANKSIIGKNPNLIRVGQELKIP